MTLSVFQVWSLAVILLSKKYKQLPHMLTTNLLLAQVGTLWNANSFVFRIFPAKMIG